MRGKDIVTEILNKRSELAESGKALDLVGDELGNHVTAYKILSENHKKVKQELYELENAEWREPLPDSKPRNPENGQYMKKEVAGDSIAFDF